MRHLQRNKLIAMFCASVAIGALALFAQPATQGGPEVDRPYAEYKSFKELQDAAVKAANAAEVGEQAIKVYMESNNTAIAQFVGAKYLWLLGKPNAAIAMLEETLAKHGNDPEPKELGMGVTTDVVCNCWIAAMARQTGDVARARKTYKALSTKAEGNPDLAVLSRIVLLYRAELEFRVEGNSERALASLRDAQKELPVNEQRRQASEMCRDWAAFEELIIQDKQKEAEAALKPTPFKLGNLTFVALGELVQMGILAEPHGGMFDESGKALSKRNVVMVLESNASAIDRTLMRLALAGIYLQKEDFAAAADLYSTVFKDHAFFSPEAGLFLAECQRENRQTTEADATLRQVRERFPAYGDVVDKQVAKQGGTNPQPTTRP